MSETLLSEKLGGFMKKIFESFAVYNRTVNRELSDILLNLSKEQIMKKEKTFYPSIFDMFLHIFRSDLSWIRRYREHFQGNPAFQEGYTLPDDEGLMKELDRDYKKLFKLRADADEIIVRFISLLTDDNLESVLVYKNFKGETVEKDLWKTLLQMFNHQTHHRGSISALLDTMGIQNDYSTLLTRI
jgi:uncharacterized damage-inducible protein DinB